MKYVKIFEEFIVEVKNQTHYYKVDNETEKRAGIPSNRLYRYANSVELIKKMKKYVFTPNILTKLSDGKVTIEKNSKSSFNLLTTTEFDIKNIETELIKLGEKIILLEGHFGVLYEFTKKHQIFVQFDTSNGIIIK